MPSFNPVERLEAGLGQLIETAAQWERGARAARESVRERGDRLARNAQERAQAGLRETRARAEALRDEVTQRLESAWEESPASERWISFRKNATEGLERGLQRAVDALPLASKREVERVNRKLNSLQRKLRKMEKQA